VRHSRHQSKISVDIADEWKVDRWTGACLGSQITTVAIRGSGPMTDRPFTFLIIRVEVC